MNIRQQPVQQQPTGDRTLYVTSTDPVHTGFAAGNAMGFCIIATGGAATAGFSCCVAGATAGLLYRELCTFTIKERDIVSHQPRPYHSQR